MTCELHGGACERGWELFTRPGDLARIIDRGVVMILIVRHGPGRGRLYPYLAATMLYIQRRQPELYQRLCFHDTGTRGPSLDGVSTVVFWLADPLREFYPTCYREAQDIANEARRRHLQIINPPEALSNSVKSTQSQLWRAAGIPTPPVYRFTSHGELRDASERCGYPLIIRSDEEHAQRNMHICREPRDLSSIPEDALRLPGAVIPLLDVRESFQRRDARDVRARFYHKKRLLVLGSRIRTKHTFFAESPIVSAATCLFGKPIRHTIRRVSHARDVAKCVRMDMTFWQCRAEHETLMRRAVDALGLDFAAIDYSDLASGSIVLWEANPYFHIPTARKIMLPYLRKPRRRVASFHEAIGRFLADLSLGSTSSFRAATDRM